MQQTILSKRLKRNKGKSALKRSNKTAKMPLNLHSETLTGISNNEVSNIFKRVQKTPQRSIIKSSENLSTEKKRRKNQIENLQSDLSPKYIGISPCDGKRSRYGRQQRYKEPDDFLPTNIACYVRRTPSKLKIITSPGRIFEQKFVSYESPIEKLINKNKFLANLAESSPFKNNSNHISETNPKEESNTIHITESDTKEDISHNYNSLFDVNGDSILLLPPNNEIASIEDILEKKDKQLLLPTTAESETKKHSWKAKNKNSGVVLNDNRIVKLKAERKRRGRKRHKPLIVPYSPIKDSPSLLQALLSPSKTVSRINPSLSIPRKKSPTGIKASLISEWLKPDRIEPNALIQSEKNNNESHLEKEKTVDCYNKKTDKKVKHTELEIFKNLSKNVISPCSSQGLVNSCEGFMMDKYQVTECLKHNLESFSTKDKIKEPYKRQQIEEFPLQNFSKIKRKSSLNLTSSPLSTKLNSGIKLSLKKKVSSDIQKFPVTLSASKTSPNNNPVFESSAASSNSNFLAPKKKNYSNTKETNIHVNGNSEENAQKEKIIDKLDPKDFQIDEITWKSHNNSVCMDLNSNKANRLSMEAGNVQSQKLKTVAEMDYINNMPSIKEGESTVDLNLVDLNEKKIKLNDTNLRLLSKSPSANSTDSAKGSSIDLEMDLPVISGVIFWGRISSYPYWPCIVWPDPEGRTISMVGKYQLKIHVRFFADNGRRSWIKKSDIFPYEGEENFERHAKEVLSKYNKKHPIYKAFYVQDKSKNLWKRAIYEADLVLAETIEKRILKFNEILEESRKNFVQKRRKRLSLNELSIFSNYSGMSEDASSTFSESIVYSNNMKRFRSPTPESTIYEDIDDLKIFVKRRKIELSGDQSVSKFKSFEELSSILSEDVDTSIEDEEFKSFYELMKSYTMCYNSENMEKQLYESVKKIWMIRSASRKELKDISFSSILSSNEMNIRRLSSRMRVLSKKDGNFVNSGVQTLQKIEKKERPKKQSSKPLKEVIKDIMELHKNYLFKGLNREPVCKICYKPSNLIKCSGQCQSWVHLACMNSKRALKSNSQLLHVTGDFEEHKKVETLNNVLVNDVVCKDCKSGEVPKCFVCKKNDPILGERTKCHLNWCGKAFHLACLKYWPQAKLTKSSTKVESLLCPGHVCHTCVSDDPRGKFLQIDKFKLAKCVECPATYHLDSFCIPAGTQFLTATHLLCPRHRETDSKKFQNVNANWCFICATGGSLICCETCPTSFHIECLKIGQPEGNYICEECETGRLPLYGEMIWAKLGIYRWWPAIIIPPPEVPMNVTLLKHNKSDFCIRFFGSNDHTWISRNRVFLYQEGDWGRVNNQTKGINSTYKNALEEARTIFQLIKEKKLLLNIENKDKGLTPLPYVKIKTNRPVPPVKLQEVDMSKLTSCDCNPNNVSPCGPSSGCINRLLLTECNAKLCPAGLKCQNQRFERRLYPPLKVSRTNSKGWGLICEVDISAGDFLIEYVGEVIDDVEFQSRIAQKQEEKDENYYFLTLEKDCIIDAGPKGNLARFMNHSCEPNCETQKWNINGITRVGLFAIKDVPANNELTFNYNLECIGDDKKICHCGAEKCAGFIGAKYKEPVKDKEPSSIQSKKKLKTKKLRKSLKEKTSLSNNK